MRMCFTCRLLERDNKSAYLLSSDFFYRVRSNPHAPTYLTDQKLFSLVAMRERCLLSVSQPYAVWQYSMLTD